MSRVQTVLVLLFIAILISMILVFSLMFIWR